MNTLKKLTILLLEDNLEFAESFCETLKLEFKEVLHAKNLKKAFNLYHNNSIDIIISDIKIADENGLEFIQKVRETDKDTPVIILSAHKDENFLFQAIGLNILSYELKPLNYVNFTKLLQLIQNKFEFTHNYNFNNDLLYNSLSKEITYKNETIPLTKKEILFLELLLQNTQKLITQEEIQTYVWKEQDMSESALKNFLMRFRKKIPTNLVTTINGLGYKLNSM